MKLDLTYSEAAQACGGTLTRGAGTDRFDVIVTDSRQAKPGTVFLALAGKVHDAHKFLPQAVSAGADGIIVRRGTADLPARSPAHMIETDDTLRALQNLAAWHRGRFDLKIAAVTGSNGKSTTKEMLRAIFTAAGTTCASKGNLNNQYGVPLSLFELTRDDRYAAFELGASQEGDIDEIARLVRPDIGIITNVSPAHLEFFHDTETVYRTKTELANHINPGGTLVYNLDNRYLRRLKTQYGRPALSFGTDAAADFRPAARTGGFTIAGPGISLEINRILPAHNLLNACGAAAAAWRLGIGPELIKRGLEEFTPMPMRLQLEEKKGALFILDAYNANPASMQAALSALFEGEYRHPLVAVLGDMKELGEQSAVLHRELGQWLSAKKPDMVFLAGPEILPALEPLEKSGLKVQYAPDYRTLLDSIRQSLSAGGTCLVKASRAMGFEAIFQEF
ncbi:MAG: UDP-N-acetylmuramoyl-tripeptide--D-alanyl-D-alanine ligase [Elusimicrobiaceae bacterium]|nr:UDP-N-acetylmuramoyl-tripeptide--D-alanyl-D-alanine ligase [Elusimicrobiaceae bacterium]